jgi:hypothetical protein
VFVGDIGQPVRVPCTGSLHRIITLGNEQIIN